MLTKFFELTIIGMSKIYGDLDEKFKLTEKMVAAEEREKMRTPCEKIVRGLVKGTITGVLGSYGGEAAGKIMDHFS